MGTCGRKQRRKSPVEMIYHATLSQPNAPICFLQVLPPRLKPRVLMDLQEGDSVQTIAVVPSATKTPCT